MPSTEESGPSVTTTTVSESEPAVTDAPGAGAQKFGKYHLKRHLATGGMAEIYLAEQLGPEGFQKEIVIKRILPHLARDRTFTDMFLDEARLAANLNHPNIGQIHELGEVDGDYYIAMEFIDGASLDELLAAGAPIPPDVAARVVGDVLQALDHAHESRDRTGNPLGLVHRDVTPSNVMVSVDGIVKLVDFGVAKAAAKSHKTQTGAVKGKFAYMAPEQVESQDIDRRADIFAIGIVFFELLTGERPFGDDLAAVSRILHEPARDPRDLAPQIPEPFARVVNRALQKDPAARYPTAHSMLLDIETALRLQNSYAGPREIAHVVRRFRGEEIASPEFGLADTGVFAADRSGELAAPIEADRQRLGLLETAAIAVPGSPHAQSTAAATAPSGEADRGAAAQALLKRFGPLLAVLLFVGSALFAVAAVWTKADTPSPLVTSDPRTTILSTSPFVFDGAQPEALFEEDGNDVVIDSIPSTRILKNGKFVGWTPHETKLSPGRHRIELELDDQRKTAEFQVKKRGTTRTLFEFEELGKKDDQAESKRKKGRRSIGAKLRSLF